MERVVNIIGMGMGAISYPDTGENWGVNASYKRCPKLDKLFFMDNFVTAPEGAKHLDNAVEPVEYKFSDFLAANPDVELISRFPDTVIDFEKNLRVPIKPYPLYEATKLAPGGYFTSTLAYMICYAIMQKVDRIRLYGFELWSGSEANEYAYQRPCVDFWLAFAMGRGIKVEVPYYLTLTAINNQNYYGYFKGEVKNK